MNIERTAAPPATIPHGLSPLALTCIKCGLTPEILDMMAASFKRTAAELRGDLQAGGRA